MASAIDKVQIRLQEAMDQGNQASLGQAIDASKGVNGLKQLRRSAKVRYAPSRMCLFSRPVENNTAKLACTSQT